MEFLRPRGTRDFLFEEMLFTTTNIIEDIFVLE